jgi:hypothetical protein
MYLAIDNTAGCKICAVIHFLHAKIMNAEEIHCELREVYRQTVTVSVCIQLLTLEHCCSISTGCCLTTLLTALISLKADYHLFTYLRYWLRSQRFNNNKFMVGVKMQLSSHAADFYDTVIQKLIPRYKCLNSSGYFVEKQLEHVHIFCIY